MDLIDIYLPTEAHTEKAGRVFADFLRSGDFIGLEGDLGAGKTSMTRGIMAGISAETIQVTSPTYTLMNHYTGNATFRHIVHADLYRLRDEDDLESTGYWDEVFGADLVVVEWIDHLPGARFENGWTVRLRHEADGRRLHITGFGTRHNEEHLRSLANALHLSL